MSKVIWFTGLSGSGKSTIALELKRQLEEKNKKVEILDGDVIRSKLTKHLGFSREEIRENNKLIANLAKEMQPKYDYILIPVISPYRQDREMAKNIIGKNVIELFINCPLEKCIEKDVKGLYKKALSGEITNFIGIAETNPYEIPLTPEITLDTHKESIEESTKKIIEYLQI